MKGPGIDEYLHSLTVFREARGQSDKEMLAVAAVIVNRSKDPRKRWPNRIASVVVQPLQFSCFNANDPNNTIWPGAQDGTFARCQRAAAAAREGDDPAKGANHYHSYPAGHPAWPKWATPDKLVATIGVFSFYKL